MKTQARAVSYYAARGSCEVRRAGLTEPAYPVAADLWRRPFLGAVQQAKHEHLIVLDVINGDEWKGSEDQLSGALDTSWTASIRERIKCVNVLDDVQSDSPRGFRPILGYVVGDSRKIVGSVRCPPNAHQAR